MTLPSLTDNIGRLTITMKNVKETASVINRSSSYNHSGLFSRSVLATPLGDLIRDIDPSELGLFTLVPQTQLAPPRDITHAGPPPEIARIEVVSATPLRKHSAQRKDAPIHFKDPEPEVFAEAALKYIDRYAHIRPMPRVRSQVTEMLEYLHQLREGIHSLSDSLKNMETSPSTSDSLSPKSLIAREEMRLHDLQARISHLKKRKEALQNNRVVAFAPMETKPSGSPEFLNSAAPDPQEDSFWTTPGARRTLQFKNELLSTRCRPCQCDLVIFESSCIFQTFSASCPTHGFDLP
ncbi:hypothetical protein B0F90DRAFT_1058118 [Multifurca ochricompacta]|uniref:Uncharacterized protein n=1 Tax=Multifurca ochricompacta TaxID=376703 RepID=A0AAD4M8V1_9AGAM|nr:hypothetical protein B0F90DRAFT_1058118 [Multifurca ochricompacta]